MGYGILDRQESAREIGRDGTRPVIERKFFNRCPDAVDACVCEHNVELSPAINYLLDGSAHLVVLADVGYNRYGLSATLLNLLGRLLNLVGCMTECSNACA